MTAALASGPPICARALARRAVISGAYLECAGCEAGAIEHRAQRRDGAFATVRNQSHGC